MMNKMCEKCRQECEKCKSLLNDYGEENLDICEFCGHYFVQNKNDTNFCICTKGDLKAKYISNVTRIEHLEEKARNKYLDDVRYDYMIECLPEDEQEELKELIIENTKLYKEMWGEGNGKRD